jgi:hypothetical protein
MAFASQIHFYRMGQPRKGDRRLQVHDQANWRLLSWEIGSKSSFFRFGFAPTKGG